MTCVLDRGTHWDPGLIRAFDASGRSNLGHALETAVLNEIERRRADMSYVKTPDGLEVDFLVYFHTGITELIQVCADPAAEQTRERELRALTSAASEEHPHARKRLLVLTQDQMRHLTYVDADVQPAYEWMLTEPEDA